MSVEITENTVRFEGVSELLPEFYNGKQAVYWCNHCQTPPQVGDGQEAVSVAHDECSKNALLKGLITLGSVLYRRE